MTKSFLVVFTADKQKLPSLGNTKQIAQDDLPSKKLIQNCNAHCPSPGLELLTTKTHCFRKVGTICAYTDVVSSVREMSCVSSAVKEHFR